MIRYSCLVALTLSCGFSFADKLTLDIQAPNISVSGTFGYKPGESLKISGKDIAGKTYELEILTKLQKDDIIQYVCRLKHADQKQSVSVITKKGLAGTIASGPKDGPPDLKMVANWTD